MRIAITGFSGSVGREVVRGLNSKGYSLSLIGRNKPSVNLARDGLHENKYLNIGAWQANPESISDCVALLHFAGCTRSLGNDDATRFEEGNVLLAAKVARLVVASRIPHLINLSSVAVYGECSEDLINASTPTDPSDLYGMTKLHGEEIITEIAGARGVSVFHVRAPAIYGLGIKGSIDTLNSLLRLMPVSPLSGIDNSRSFLSILNLVDLLDHLIRANSITKKVVRVPVADSKPLSTSDLCAKLIEIYGHRHKLIRLPLFVQSFLLKHAESNHACSSLLNSMAIDPRAAEQMIDWSPTYDMYSTLKDINAKF